MTEAVEIQPGVRVARVVTGEKENLPCIRVINLGDQPAMSCKDQLIGRLHPVDVAIREKG